MHAKHDAHGQKFRMSAMFVIVDSQGIIHK